jgi:hypothetical protein
MYLLKIYLVVIFLIFFSSCDYSDNRLHFYNKSPNVVSVATSLYYTDTIGNSIKYYLEDSIEVMQQTVFKKPSGINKDGWSIEIRNSKDKKLKLYVFNLDTLKKYDSVYTMTQLVSRKCMDTVFIYSEVQLDSLDWIIEFN